MLRRIVVLVFLLYPALWCATANAQVCTGSLGTPVVNETFGAGTNYGTGPQLGAGITNLKYVTSACGAEDGEYSITTELGSGCKGGTWQVIGHDHTGDPFGYFMVINASYTPSIFYTQTVKGSLLCPNTTYEFAAWIMNILVKSATTATDVQPNITFRIEKADGTLLKSYDTGTLPFDRNPDWQQYGTFFTSPADGSDVVVKMINNGPGGAGNDLAMDDITFKPCGPIIQTGFSTIGNTGTKLNCAGEDVSYTLVAQQTGYPSPVYQWQQNINDGKGWTNIQNQQSTSLQVTLSKASAGYYQYRIGVLTSNNIGSDQCTIYSEPLNINVSAYPVTKVSPATSGCIGFPVSLSATGGDTYQWSGPNGFASSIPNPVILNAQTTDNGLYTVVVTINGCPTISNTQLTVYPKVTIQPLADASYCENSGASVQLNVIAANANHYKWHPSAGLSADDIPNPVASPAVTTQYVVEAYNDGCPDVRPTVSTTITVLKNPVADAGKDIKMFEGETKALNGTKDGDDIVRTYWTPRDFLDNPESLMPNTSATHDITYTLHVVSPSCGEATSNVFVRVYQKIKIPNTFSPNGDGINDIWNITNLNTYPNSVISIYNRNGTRVYQSRGYTIPWDGLFAGSALPAGTYYYVINPRENNIPPTAGWIFLVR